MGVPFGRNALFELVSSATRSVPPAGGYRRSTSDVMWERYFRLEIWSYVTVVGRPEGNVGWISARRQDWMCLFSGWGKARIAQIIDVAVVSCPAARKVINWSRMLDYPSELV